MSKEMKIIMESWRSSPVVQKVFGDTFKHDAREPKEIEDDNLPLALLIDVNEYSEDESGLPKHELVLYKPTVKQEADNVVVYSSPRVIGMITVSLTSYPCITPTFQVNFSAVDSEFQGEGYGSLMYGMAFHYVNNMMGAGLTSDHDHSTSPSAEKMWDKLADTKGMVKKKTAAGNDEFDYRDKTDDPDDDCDFGYAQKNLKSDVFGDKYRTGNATSHSWIMRNNKFKSVFEKLRNQNDIYFDLTLDKKQFTNDLVIQASKLFDKEYGE